MNTSLKHIGIGFITGFCIGFALKKGIKILSFLLLLYLVLKFFLDYNEMHLSKDMALETSDRAMTYFYDIKNADCIGVVRYDPDDGYIGC